MLKEGVRISHQDYVLLDFVCEYDRPIYFLYILVRHVYNLIIRQQSFCDYYSTSCQSVMIDMANYTAA